jgi:F0F1-type ATP synthase assembly protein I
MEQSVFEHAGQQIDDTTHKATRAASAVAAALQDSISAARREMAPTPLRNFFTTQRGACRRHSLETVAVTFAAGIAVGATIGWIMRRKKIQR